jgi:hypothetical protein
MGEEGGGARGKRRKGIKAQGEKGARGKRRQNFLLTNDVHLPFDQKRSCAKPCTVEFASFRNKNRRKTFCIYFSLKLSIQLGSGLSGDIKTNRKRKKEKIDATQKF